MKYKSLIKYFSVAATLVVAVLFFAVTAPADASPTLGCTFHTNAGEVGLPEQGCEGVTGSINLGTCHIVSPVTETVTKGTFAGTTFTYDIACDDGSGTAYHYSTTGGVVPVVNDVYYTFDNFVFNPLGDVTIFDENGTGQDATGYVDLTSGLYGIGLRLTFGIGYFDAAPLAFPVGTAHRSGSISFWFKSEGNYPRTDSFVRGQSLGETLDINYTVDSNGDETWRWGVDISGTVFYPIPSFTWTHVAYVNDTSAGQQRLYINGQLVDTAPAAAAIGAGGVTSMALGTGSAVMDEYRAWIGALSAADVANLATP